MIKFLKRMGLFKPPVLAEKKPLIIPRRQHTISREHISKSALKVLYRLHQQGYQAYLVGGGVRDLLLGLHPKDFDVVTNARPEQIRRIFRNCRLIGRRFRLAHIHFGEEIIEVATFRGNAPAAAQGMILRDNVYGTLAEDAWRRDFTINALYYNIADFSLVDYTGGFADLKAKRLRMIGEVDQRYREDPVRMLRAIRIASKVGFLLPGSLTSPFATLKTLIYQVSAARLFEEVIKLFHAGVASQVYVALKEHGLFEILFPAVAKSLYHEKQTDLFLTAVFQNTDLRLQEKKSVTPAFIIAALLWYPICYQTRCYQAKGWAHPKTKAIEALLKSQAQHMAIPRRIIQAARDIWLLQVRLERCYSRTIDKLAADLRFRAAYDFLELRAKVGEAVAPAKWWRHYLAQDESGQRKLIHSLKKGRKKKSQAK